MINAYTRKKQPEQVRRALLDCAARLAVEKGLTNLTVHAVAEAAGVTKGGLFHHFPNKQALVEAVFTDLLERLDTEIDTLLAQDADLHGRFTRAYIKTTIAEKNHTVGNAWIALSLSMITDASVTRLWSEWLAGRLERHRATDGSPMLEIVRLAVDGAWLALMMKVNGASVTDIPALRARLIALTQQNYGRTCASEPDLALPNEHRAT